MMRRLLIGNKVYFIEIFKRPRGFAEIKPPQRLTWLSFAEAAALRDCDDGLGLPAFRCASHLGPGTGFACEYGLFFLGEDRPSLGRAVIGVWKRPNNTPE